MGLIPSWGTKAPYAKSHGQGKKKKKTHKDMSPSEESVYSLELHTFWVTGNYSILSGIFYLLLTLSSIRVKHSETMLNL